MTLIGGKYPRWLAALALAALLAPAAVLAGYEDLESEVQEIVLDNGLKLLLLERHDVPVFSFMTYVDVGAVDEDMNKGGLAHVCEHMAFKGTQEVGTRDYRKERDLLEAMDALYVQILAERLKGDLGDADRLAALEAEFAALQERADALVEPNEFSKLVEINGGVGMNAMTSTDATRYFYSVPSNQLEFWAALESDRFINPVFRQFYKECNVISEERRQVVESSPQGRLYEEWVTLAFKAHPYGQPIIGHRSEIEAYTRPDAEAFFRSRYGAQKIVVAVVGDVYRDELERVARKYWGEVPPAPAAEPLRLVEPEQLGERRVILEDPSQPVVLIGYHVPDARHADTPAVEALADILGRGRASRLYTKLVKEDKSALFAGAFAGIPGDKYPNSMLVFGVPNSGVDPLELEASILAELDRVMAEGVTEAELAGYRNRARANFVRGLESNTGMANQLCYAEKVLGGWQRLFHQLDLIEAITPADVQRVAGQYLTKSNRTVGLLVTQPAAGQDS
ncbi:MAG: insulinase family protein [Candidatus Krumholzibacteriota bacterium]|nr:insulinase family protein [Candidatus Krumholzibacteriota bacterium]